MSTNKVTDLKRTLTRFVNEVRENFVSGASVDESTIRRLEKQYIKLYNLYSTIDEDTINGQFSQKDIRLINFLSLGRGRLEEMYEAVASCFSENADQSAIDVALFVKGRRAYDLVNKTTRTKEQTQELATIFGSILGVKVTSEFVASMRAEEMGRIIGYALSGLCEEDMRAWKDPTQGRVLRKTHGSLDKYLLDRIRASDKWASFRFEEDPNGEVFATALKINEHEGAGDKARGRNLVDHCFIKRYPNHQEGEARGVITLGTSTSVIFAQDHGFSFAKAVYAAQALVNTKTINGKENPYYRFEIQTYCFFSGHSPTTDLAGNMERSELVKLLESGRPPSQGGLTDRQITELGWLPFMSLFASTNPSPVLWRALAHINPMIAGCDTFPLYELQTAKNRQKREYSTSRRLPKMVIEYAARQANLLAQNNITLDLSANGPQKALQPMLEVILALVKNHFLNFPVMDNQALTRDEEKSFDQLAVSLEKIGKKIGGTVSRQDLAREFMGLARNLSNPRRRKEDMLADIEMCAPLDRSPVFSEELYYNIDALKHYDHGGKLNVLSDSVKDRIKSGLATETFIKVFNEIDSVIANFDAPISRSSANFWQDYKACLLHALSDRENSEWQGSYYDSWAALNAAKASFNQELAKTSVCRFVCATGPLIGQQGPAGGRPLSERIKYRGVSTSIRSTAKAMVAVARESISDSLAAELRGLTEASTPAASPRLRRKG